MNRLAVVTALRWVAVVPGAILAGYLAYIVGGFINNLSTTLVVGPPRGWLAYALDFMAHMYMGMGIIFAASRIAPSHKPRVAVIAAVACVLLTGFLLYPAIQTQHYGAMIGSAGLLFGVGAFLISVLGGEGTEQILTG